MPAAEPARGAIAAAETEGLLAPLAGRAHVALAVSGGADSTALMVLAARWREADEARPRLTALTVDHRLRPDSAAEACRVGEWAAALRIGHAVLAWAGAKPASGIEAAARRARYALLLEWCRAHGAGCLLTAHTLEDQAETVLMRLARGSGVDGLAGIARESVRGGVIVLRPLLGLSHERLRSSLEAWGHPWLDDPSNRDRRFERVRLREARPLLDRLGLDARALAATARRMARAREALEQATAAAFSRAVCAADAGFCRVDPDAFAAEPAELRLRLLARMLQALAGADYPPATSALERLDVWLGSGAGGARTLGGCRIARHRQGIFVGRETGRMPQPALVLGCGERRVWDRRFEVAVQSARGPTAVAALRLEVAPLDAGGRELFRAALPRLPAFLGHGLPAFWHKGELACVPHLGLRRGLPAGVQVEATFANRVLLEGAAPWPLASNVIP